MAPVILYDLPSKGRCACWSLNPWKTRMALNYKNIEYETQWLEYPDVAPTLRAAGLAPNEGGPEVTAYTIPTVKFPDGTYVMESFKIAQEIEKRYSSAPPLRLDHPVVAQIIAVIPTIQKPLSAVLIPRVPRVLLNDKSVPYFQETRKVRFGMSLDEYEKEKGGDAAWVAAKQPIENLAALLRQTKTADGPYFLGSEVSYADFIVASLLHFVKLLGPELYDRFVTHDKAFDDLYQACAKWLERDDH
ncbi:Glutathione S-transferase-like protein ustS [Lasiodiplodia theobromae]|uniref:Glutathione S-transferase-like protein ustS n=2 Tax=Lasiodiplodia theobromae TaxID=45133 RepID=A0A5N5D2D7_9PEZI|nr:Glutathione S-transferase-like protein ustS [Lasiodiplodia theobromae]